MDALLKLFNETSLVLDIVIIFGDTELGHETWTHLQGIMLRFLKFKSNLIRLQGLFIVIHILLLASLIIKANGKQ